MPGNSDLGVKRDRTVLSLVISAILEEMSLTVICQDMEATMEITCTEGNAVAMVSVFGQHLSKNTTNKYILSYKIAKKLLIQAYKMVYNTPH